MGRNEVAFGGPPPHPLCREIKTVQAERARFGRERRLPGPRQLRPNPRRSESQSSDVKPAVGSSPTRRLERRGLGLSCHPSAVRRTAGLARSGHVASPARDCEITEIGPNSAIWLQTHCLKSRCWKFAQNLHQNMQNTRIGGTEGDRIGYSHHLKQGQLSA